MDPIQQFEQLVGQRAAYPVVAMLLMFVMQIIRKSPWTKVWYAKIPSGWRFLPPVVTGAAMGFVHGYQAGYGVKGALIETVAGIFGVSFIAMGGAAMLKESPLPWDGGSGGKPRPPKPKPAAPPA